MDVALRRKLTRASVISAITVVVGVLIVAGLVYYRQRARMHVVLIHAGRFHMGPATGDNAHEVTLTQDFFLSTTEVTQWQFVQIMGFNPSKQPKNKRESWRDPIGWLRGVCWNDPVVNVSWGEAIEFCNRLSDREDLEVCYEKAGGEWEYFHDRLGYRLPTAAEWEYACRAGSTSNYSFGDDAARLEDFAWYGTNSGGTTHEVATKLANAWGLYDMHGNAWEWCWDWLWTSSSDLGFGTDPRGPESGDARVVRGGAMNWSAESCSAFFAIGYVPTDHPPNVGFRVARGIPRKNRKTKAL